MVKWAGRGRPKTARPDGKDRGTQELQKKKSSGLLDEPADICLRKGIITAEEHWCAIHFRWLYTLRYGLPSVTALNLEISGTGGTRLESSEWDERREAEYQEAAEVLKKYGAHREIINFAVMNILPNFLCGNIESNYLRAEASLDKIKTGLGALSAIWGKGSDRRKVTTEAQKEKPEVQQGLHR